MTDQPNKSSTSLQSEPFKGEEAKIASWQVMLAYHIVVTSLMNALVSVLTWVLWSTLFYGDDMYKTLEDNNWISFLLLPACMGIVFVLYMLDFFWPPHLQQMFVLFDGDWILGRGIFAVTMVMFVLACLLNTMYFASLPLMISIIICPMATLATHWYDPFIPKEKVQGPGKRRTEIVNTGSTEEKMRLLKRITGEEQSESMFYLGCLTSFALWFVINLSVFVFGTVLGGKALEELTSGLNDSDKNAKLMQWCAPLVMAIANFVYGIFACMRVAVQRQYNRTDRYKNQLIADLSNTSIMKDVAEHKKAELLINARNSNISELERGAALKEKQDQYLKQHAAMVNQLSTILKGTVCFFVVLLGLCYSAGQLLYSDTHIATMVAGTMGVFFLIFCVFAYVSLHRVVKAMGKWIVELPAWQMFQGLLSNVWVRAMFLCPLIPMIPAVVALSWLNQKVRKCRGIYNCLNEPGRASEHSDMGPNPQQLSLTPRVSFRMTQLAGFPWLAIMPRIYIWCFVFFCYVIVTPPLKVGLAAMNKAITEVEISYGLILVAIFLTGIFLFLLPPVPGAVMYMFGGLLSSTHCPWPEKGDKGFWPGAFISLGLGLVMKLVACAMQQAGIGGLLGRNLWVRQTAGVHKPMVRCVEKVLRQKGFTAGKIAILCGGPDWPTSVLAGILGLSVVEMLIGTLPIIFFITPFGLSGSLLLRSSEGGMWTSSAQLMLVVAALSSLGYWAVACWACQQVLEKHRDEVTRPLRQNVDLEFLDYRAKVIEVRSAVTWAEVPGLVKILTWIGAVVQIMTCYIFQFGFSYLVGSFELNDNVDLLTFVGWTPGQEANCSSCTIVLFSYACLVVIGLYGFAWFGYVQYRVWFKRRIKIPKTEALKELSLVEAQWKEDYLQYCDSYGSAASKGMPDPLNVLLKNTGPPGMQEIGDSTADGVAHTGLFVSV